jgi:hypothetical protein
MKNRPISKEVLENLGKGKYTLGYPTRKQRRMLEKQLKKNNKNK